MSGQHDAAVRDVAVTRGQRGEQVGLAPVVVEGQRRGDTVPGKVAAHPLDEGEVGVAARRVESDERANEVERNEVFGARGRGGRTCASVAGAFMTVLP